MKISLLTPTCNRSHFFPRLLKCIENQTYPKENIEWIILDDSDNNHYSFFQSVPYVVYVHIKEKKNIGTKRNLLNKMATGKILINIDDDDYYPPHKISHTVQEMTKNPSFQVSGSSYVHMYDKHGIYIVGPYSKNHATANTLAYTKEYTTSHFYAEVQKGEERAFLENYKTNILQLKDLILVIRHISNTANKMNLRQLKIKETTLHLTDFMSSSLVTHFI
jgi:glycosyltransferase involved in cell wall biosynthesis